MLASLTGGANILDYVITGTIWETSAHTTQRILVPQDLADSQKTLSLHMHPPVFISKLRRPLELQETEERVCFLQQEVFSLLNEN